MNTIWSPVKVGELSLSHRLAMAPMTRSRAKRTAPLATAPRNTMHSAVPSGCLFPRERSPLTMVKATWPHPASTPMRM